MADYSDAVERAFEVTLRSGDEFMVRCPRHEDRSASLQVNVVKGLFVCFSCGWKGSIRKLLGNIKEPEPEIADVLTMLDAVDAAAARAAMKARVLPEATLKRYSFPTEYWASRRFTATTIEAWDLGYDALEDDAIIPIRDLHGHLISIARRRLSKDVGPKYLYQKGFQRTQNLFGSWMVDGEMVAITEGPLDAISVWQAGYPAVAQYGSALNEKQVSILHQMGVADVVLFYDNDLAGRKATEHALPLLRDFMVYLVDYRVGDPKDPGAMSMNRIRKRVSEVTSLLGF
jgi:DNA primase